MKTKVLCILFAVLLCVALVGCGSNQMDNGGHRDDMNILPDVSPMISPDPADGVVNDQDGVIGNGQHGADSDNNDSETGTAVVSPSPANDAGSSAMPTTAPSASPNP